MRAHFALLASLFAPPLVAQEVTVSAPDASIVIGPRRAPASPAQGQQPETSKTPGKISGRVTNAVTSEPLKRVSIVLYPAEMGPNAAPSSTMTDAEGRFAMSDVPPGQYRAMAERTGFVRRQYGARGTTSMGVTISLEPGQDLKQVDFQMQPHAVITGRVTDEEGEPLAYVQVQPMMYRYMQGRRQLMPAGGSMTNDLGEYRIFGLAPGRYYLSAALRQMGMGSGAVDRSATAQQEQGFATTYYPGTNDPTAAIQVNVAAGRPLSGVDIQLRRTRTARIRGRVVNMPKTPARPMVFLVPREGGMMMFDRNTAPVYSAEGRFELRNVTPGSYYLLVQAFDAQDRQFARLPVDVGGTNIDDLEVTLSPAQDVTGTIRIEGEGQQVPVSSMRLFLEPKVMTPMGGGGMSVTKDDGSFVIQNAPPDTYRIRVMMPQNQGYVKSVRVGNEEAKDNEITILPGVAQPITVVVSTAAAQVSGEVKSDKDAPAQGAMVVLVPDTAKREQSQLYKTATTDQYGRYSLQGIAPGTYKLFAWDTVEFNQWMDPDFLQVFESKGESVTVREGSKEAVSLTLLNNTSAEVQ